MVFISSWYFGALQVASVLGVSQTVNSVFCACELASSFFQEQPARTFSPRTQVRSLHSWDWETPTVCLLSRLCDHLPQTNVFHLCLIVSLSIYTPLLTSFSCQIVLNLCVYVPTFFFCFPSKLLTCWMFWLCLSLVILYICLLWFLLVFGPHPWILFWTLLLGFGKPIWELYICLESRIRVYTGCALIHIKRHYHIPGLDRAVIAINY